MKKKMRFKTFESFFSESDLNMFFKDIVEDIDDYIEKKYPDKNLKVKLFEKIKNNVSEVVLQDLLNKRKADKNTIRELREKNKKLGQELNALMNNRNLEKKRLDLLNSEILFKD
jgi:uncharacterized protein YaaW (UPF0174 family)